ncbi:MAG: hydroxylamine reductase [Bacteroidales bacterium]|nr:hydroxylamine reductase [Bacteroidales bacterium]
MFCFQCQEAAQNIGCTVKGVCGKTDNLAKAMDVLVYVCKGIAVCANKLQNSGIQSPGVERFILNALFKTVTNVNFDKTSIIKSIYEGIELKRQLYEKLKTYGLKIENEKQKSSVEWEASCEDDIMKKADELSLLNESDEDIRSLKEILTYGIKGMAAYAEHAYILNHTNTEIYNFIYKALAATLENLSIDELLTLVMECGKFGVLTMELLDKANTFYYGNPEISVVKTKVGNNPGILVSGHDLKDLEDLLIQTEGTGVDVYTHGEMLPAHYYPYFKKYKHLIGNYGGSWWQQREEFEKFNGPILFTTNCIVPPLPTSSYKDRIYVTGATGLENAKYIPDRPVNGMKDFSEIIEHAKKCLPPEQLEDIEIVGGFAHHQVLSLVNKIIDAVKSGKIKKFVVMAGCDGRHKTREYYTEFAKLLPKNTVILTAGCAKYRYIKLPLGNIDGIPRVLDAGQCNDSYSLAIIALKLKNLFGLNDINELPIVYNIAWYEQKAVIVLLALLYLGVKHIHLGPTLPAFVSKNVANILIEKFNISGISQVKEDLEKLIGS